MTRSLTGDWTRDLPHSKPALYHQAIEEAKKIIQQNKNITYTVVELCIISPTWYTCFVYIHKYHCKLRFFLYIFLSLACLLHIWRTCSVVWSSSPHYTSNNKQKQRRTDTPSKQKLFFASFQYAHRIISHRLSGVIALHQQIYRKHTNNKYWMQYKGK